MTEPPEASEHRIPLSPPLRRVFAIEYGHVPSWLPVVHEHRVFIGTPDQVVALHVLSGEVLWRSPGDGFPLFVCEGKLVVRRLLRLEVEWADLLDPATGAIVGRLPNELSPLAAAGDRVVCQRWEADGYMCGVELATGTELWRWPGKVWHAAADSERVYVAVGDRATALDLESGRELWSHNLADLTWQVMRDELLPGSVRGGATLCGERLVLLCQGGWVVALETRDGSRAWTHRCSSDVAQGFAEEREYHVLAFPGELVTFELTSGRVLRSVNLDNKMPRPRPIRGLSAPLLLSQTHIFTGSSEGCVVAFDRARGKYVWIHCPKGAAATDHDRARFVVAGNRLYYSDMSFRLYCLEQAPAVEGDPGTRTNPVKPPRKVPDRRVLRFQVTAVAHEQQLTGMPPYHGPGGRFTVWSCVSMGRHAAEFCLAEDRSRPGNVDAKAEGSGVMWVPSAPHATTLAAALTAAFSRQKNKWPPVVTEAAAPRPYRIAVHDERDPRLAVLHTLWIDWIDEPSGAAFTTLINKQRLTGMLMEREPSDVL